MTRNLKVLLMALLTASGAAAQRTKVYPDAGEKPEKNIPEAFDYEAKFFNYKGNNIHYVEYGTGDPIIFLHGIPTWSYLWRNVINKVGGNRKRAIALDFLGYGKSDYPKEDAVKFQDQYDMLDAFINSLNAEKITLVVNDLGSLIGNAWAMDHEDKVKGLVIIEGVFMPSDPWIDQLTFRQKMMVSMMRNKAMAKRMLVNKNMGPKMMVPMFTKRKLSKQEKQMYVMPFEEEKRRFVLLHGPGPSQFPMKNGNNKEGMRAVLENFPYKMQKTEVPIHLIYARKGLIVRKKAIEYARNHFKNYSETFIGKGIHFLPESHPTRISKTINEWYESL